MTIGLLNITKPVGKTSRDVVNVVQRLVRPAKAGHAGTLDPIATGVLVVCVGPATRLIPFVQDTRKVYQATFRFGFTSETDDIEREVTPIADAPVLSRQQIEAVLPNFIGQIQQIPPTHSAVHVNGQRAYDLARQGIEFELSAKTVEVYRLEVLKFEPSAQELNLEIECGSGTYIRSLGRDIAIKLGTAAVMTQLCRTAVGPFHLSNAISLQELTSEKLTAALQPVSLAVRGKAKITLDAPSIESLRHGRFLPLPKGQRFDAESDIAIFDEQDSLIAIARLNESDATLRPRIVLPHA